MSLVRRSSNVIVLALLLVLVLSPMAALASPTSAGLTSAAPAAAASQPSAAPADVAAASLLAPDQAYKGKWIDINLSRQRLTAYVGQKAVYSVIVSTGVRATPTVTGRFTIRTKLLSQTMVGPGYRLPGVPYVMYFYGGYAIHGTYWHHNFGHPMSHGCVNLPTAAAGWMYRWAPVGTPVYVHY